VGAALSHLLGSVWLHDLTAEQQYPYGRSRMPSEAPLAPTETVTSTCISFTQEGHSDLIAESNIGTFIKQYASAVNMAVSRGPVKRCSSPLWKQNKSIIGECKVTIALYLFH